MIRVASSAAIMLLFASAFGASSGLAAEAADGQDGGTALAQDAPSRTVGSDDYGKGLYVPVYPGRPWESRSTPLADDPRQQEPTHATVYDRATVRDARIEDLTDVAIATPGMQVSGTTNRITLRGVGSLTLFTTVETPVALYIDDVYVSSPAAFNFDLFDIERIEVLRGPQGFDGGRGAVAGAVRIETVGPRPENAGEIEVAAGSFDHRQVRAHLNTTSQGEVARNRVAAAYTERDGTVHNLATGERIDTRQNWGLRDQLTFLLGPELTATLSLDFADYTPVRSAAGGFDSVLDGEVEIFDSFTENRELYGSALRVERVGESVDAVSITAVRGLQFENSGSDFSADDLLFQGLELSQLDMSQELRFTAHRDDGLDWTAGTFLYGELKDEKSLVQLNNAAFSLGLQPGHRESSLSDQRLWSAAAYGEATWHLGDRFNVFGGLRASYDHGELDYRYVSSDGIAVLAPIQARGAKTDFADLAWRLGASVDLTAEIRPYAAISRASKSGGFNTVQLPSGDIGFGEETATNYEIGLKSRWFGGMLIANAAAFELRRDDQQVQNVAAFSAPTVNAKSSRSRGLELTLAGRPVPGLDLSLAYAYIDSEFLDFADFPGAKSVLLDLSGRHIPFVSRHSLSAALQYVRPLTETTRLVVRGDYSYRSAFYFDPENNLRQPGYGLWNARIGLQGARWGLYGWGKNLANTRYRTSALVDVTSGPLAIAGEPRTLGVEFRYRF